VLAGYPLRRRQVEAEAMSSFCCISDGMIQTGKAGIEPAHASPLGADDQ